MESDIVHSPPLWTQILSLIPHSQTRGTVSLHNNSTRSCDHLMCSSPGSFLRTSCSRRKPVSSLLQYAAPYCSLPHHLACFAIGIFISSNWTARQPSSVCSEAAVKAGFGLCSNRLLSVSVGDCGWLCVNLTSPHDPGFPTYPDLRWCRVCHRTPDCCVCSGPPSSETPDSSCPAGTCNTIHQPPSHRTLCPLRYIRTYWSGSVASYCNKASSTSESKCLWGKYVLMAQVLIKTRQAQITSNCVLPQFWNKEVLNKNQRKKIIKRLHAVCLAQTSSGSPELLTPYRPFLHFETSPQLMMQHCSLRLRNIQSAGDWLGSDWIFHFIYHAVPLNKRLYF